MPSSPLSLFRRLTNGVYIVGVAHGEAQDVFTAAWITQVSFAPLLLALSINREHASYPILMAGQGFTVNVLRQGQLTLAKHCGTQSGRDVAKLSGLKWRPGGSGAPILLDTLGYLECQLTDSVPAGDHELVIAEVVGGDVLAPDAIPMAYAETGNLDGSAEIYPQRFTGER